MIILHVITRLIQGGAQQNTVLSCAAQVKAGHEVHLAYGPIYGPEGSLLEEAKASGAVLHEIKSMRRAVNPWYDVRCYYALRKLIREVQPDIVHTHSSKAGIIGRAAAWAERVAVVVHTVHGLPFHDRQSAFVHWLYVSLERWAAKRCHHLVAITPAMVEAFEAEGIAYKERFTVVSSGIEVDGFANPAISRNQAKEKHGYTIDIPTIGLVARFDPLKGHHDLVEAVRIIWKERGFINVCFIGAGWNERQVLEMTKGWDSYFSDLFTFWGLVPMHEMPEAYRALDIVVLPSYQEGQSRVLAEALLCGCGIVAYDVGGIPSICIDGETGKLVPVGDKQALADAIIWMIEHPKERRAMTERGRQLVREKFSAEYMTRELEKLYQHLLAEKTSRQESSHG